MVNTDDVKSANEDTVSARCSAESLEQTNGTRQQAGKKTRKAIDDRALEKRSNQNQDENDEEEEEAMDRQWLTFDSHQLEQEHQKH